jgi:hypothetical protein
MAANRATFMRKARRIVASFLPLVLAVSTLSAISLVTAPSASANTNVTATGTNADPLCNQQVNNPSGVTAERIGNDCVVRFLSSGISYSWTVPAGIATARVLVVGGGGGGGADAGGGGGGGGVYEGTINLGSQTGRSFAITVGSGGLRVVFGTPINRYNPTDTTNPGGSSGGATSVSVADSQNQSLNIVANGGAFGSFGTTATAANGSVSVSNVPQSFSLTETFRSVGGSGGAGFGVSARGNGSDGSGGYAASSSFPGLFGGGGGGGASFGDELNTGTGGNGSNAGGLGASGRPSVLSRFATAGATNAGGGGGGGGAYFNTPTTTIDPVTDNPKSGAPGGSGVVIVRYAIPTVVVTFNSNFGTATTSTQTIFYNNPTNLTANSFTRSGYNFAGWHTNDAGTGGVDYSNGGSITATTNIALFAKWTGITCTKKESTPTVTPPVVIKLSGCDSIKQGLLKTTSDTVRLISCV